MAYEELAVLRQLGGDGDVAGSVLARAQAQEAIDDAAEARRAEARKAEFERRGEVLALANYQMGDPLGQIRMHQLQAADLADKVTDLENQLAKAKGRLEACRSSIRFWSDRLMVVEEQSARSRVPDPLEEAAMRAADALREHHEGRLIVERARRSLRQRSQARPPAEVQARSGGDGVRVRSGGEILGVS